MDRLISEQAVIDVINGCLINRQTVIDKIKAIPSKNTETQGDDRWLLHFGQNMAIPSAEPYKGMTNGEVIRMLYPQGEIVKGLYGIRGNPLICVNLNISKECSEMVFTEDWWNSPYKGEQECIQK